MKKPHQIASGILPIHIESKQICLAWRSDKVAEGNCWGTIGGGVKAGMTLEEGALAELGEEVGYYGEIELHLIHVLRHKQLTYHTFAGIVPVRFEFNPEPEYAYENDRMIWESLDVIYTLIVDSPHLFHPGLIQSFIENISLLKRLVK